MPGSVRVPLDPPPRARLRSAARLAVCAAVPWFLCLWWGTSTVPVPAALPAVLILRDDVYAAPRLGWDRLVGVVVGVVLTALVLHWLPAPTADSVSSVSWAASASFLAVLACGCAGMYLMYRGGTPNQQVLVTALVIYATATPGYALARLAESAVGIATVVLLGPLLWPPDPYRSAAAGLDAYRGELGGLLGTVATRLGSGGPPAARDRPEEAQLWGRPGNGLAAYERAARRTRLTRLYLRTPGRPPNGLEERLRLAARTALTLQYFTQELRERARTDGPAPPAGADTALRDLAPLVRATARTVDAALRDEDRAAAAADLDRSRALDLAHRAAHPTRHDVVLRAGLHLTHEAVAEHLAARG
ncbi:hypothetical protein ACIQZO_04485 [Streptomyces sp. NPDC097617]|uniref:hypothetical protein n=1 Tax=Streptomyces sp. NPDC097617 TaxID=3366091 RepID=UPI0037FF1957